MPIDPIDPKDIERRMNFAEWHRNANPPPAGERELRNCLGPETRQDRLEREVETRERIIREMFEER